MVNRQKSRKGGHPNRILRHWRQRQLMDDGAAAKRSRLEQHPGLGLSDGSSFPMEDLPEEIHRLIFSLLPLKEAASTSIVSQNWRRLWTLHPNLCFDGSKDRSTTETESVKIERAKFIETVNSVVEQHCGLGLNKFSIRCRLEKDSSAILDRWIRFATASKATIVDINLLPERNNAGPTEQVYQFPLEAFTGGAQHIIHSLFITNVSIKPHDLDICGGLTKLRSLHLHCVQIIGDLPGLLLSCRCSLEDLEMITCRGVTHLSIPHPLDKLRRLLISNMRMIRMVEFHVPNLSHFEYRGSAIPIVLGGCSKLHEVTLNFPQTCGEEKNNKVMGHVFHGIPSITAVKVINVHAFMWTNQRVWSPQATARPACVFMNLRHLTYEITFITARPNSQSGILQLAQYLAFAPQLETLEVHVAYFTSSCHCWRGEGVSYRMPRHDHLKTVYMSGFQCYRAEVELLYGILEMGAALEHVTIEPRARQDIEHLRMPEYEICKWADRTSRRFGKPITVVKCP